MSRLAHAADGLGPAHDLFDAFADGLADLITTAVGGAAIQPVHVASFDTRNVRLNAVVVEPLHKLLVVVTLVCAHALYRPLGNAFL